MEERYITAIDMGTSKLALTVARIDGENVQIVFYKTTSSDGIRNSSIFNPAKVAARLKDLVKEAEDELKIKITNAVVGLPRYCVRQETGTATINRTDGNSIITREEIDSMKDLALESYPLDDSKKEIIYGAAAQSFSTEDYFQQIESDIIGMPSDTLSGNFKIFVGAKRPISNIDSVFNSINLAISKKYFIPEIIAKGCLSPEEIENGAALIDFGAGVTSVTVYQGNILRHYGAIPFGGQVITNDIKTECSISADLAENIKQAYGACMPNKLQTLSEKIIQIEKDDISVQVPVKYLSEIITSRVKEIIEAILYEIQESGFADNLRNGVVLTGGGANLTNCANYIKEMSGYNVRVGFPKRNLFTSSCNGIFETETTSSLGMILAAKGNRHINCVSASETYQTSRIQATGQTHIPSDIPDIKTPHVQPSRHQVPSSTDPTFPEAYAPADRTHVAPIPAKSQEPSHLEAKKPESKEPDLINPEEFGPKQEKPKKPQREHAFWKKFTKSLNEGVGTLYDKTNNDSI